MLDCGAWIWILLSFSSDVSLSLDSDFTFLCRKPRSVSDGIGLMA
jgi:hypothetical protein